MPPSSEAGSKPSLWDRLGLGLSGLCMVHCLLLPVAVALLPLWPALEEVHEGFHLLLAVVLIPTTLFAMRSGYRHHRDRGILGVLAGGLFVVVVVALFGHDVLGNLAATGLTLVGSVLLITGHWRNWRRQSCRTSHVHDYIMRDA